MHSSRTLRIAFSIGLFTMFGADLIHFIIPINDFVFGFLNGTGIAIVIMSFYRMKRKSKTVC